MEENKCVYVSSHGIMKSCDLVIASKQAAVNLDFSKLSHKTVVYLKPDFMQIFVQNAKQFLKTPIILVSGDSDYTVPDDLFVSKSDLLEFIESPYILRWFAQNRSYYYHPKLHKIPIGLDYHSIQHPNNLGWGDVATPLEQEAALIETFMQTAPFWERTPKCYSNFHFFTNTRYGYDRKDAIAKIPSSVVFYEPEKTRRADAWMTQSKYAFVVCPHGNGMDTHRLYEALILGCIAVVRTSPLDELFEHLPVLILREWGDLTEELLLRTIDRFKSLHFQYDKLTLKYWVSKIRDI
jgi:hypothetical protein